MDILRSIKFHRILKFQGFKCIMTRLRKDAMNIIL